VSVREYRELEAGERVPDFATWDRICKLYGWPQTFVRQVTIAQCVRSMMRVLDLLLTARKYIPGEGRP
jgi:hypothetical protein